MVNNDHIKLGSAIIQNDQDEKHENGGGVKISFSIGKRFSVQPQMY